MVLADGSAACRTRRFDEWRDIIRENFVALDMAPNRRQGVFDGSVRSSTLGPLQVSTVRSVPQTCVRTPGLAGLDATGYLQVGLVTRGAGALEQDGRRAALGAGDFALYETDRPFRWTLSGSSPGGWELLVLTWPRSAVRLSPAESYGCTAQRLAGRGGLSGAVGGMLRALVSDPPELTPAGAARVADEVGDLVGTLALEHLRGHGPATGPQADLMRRFDRWLDEHLADPDLGPAAVAAAHSVSTRQLHRLFAAESDTVTRRIQRLRLERCRRELQDRSRAGEPISAVARRWGFVDLPSFSRAFRRAYGVPPSAYRARFTGR